MTAVLEGVRILEVAEHTFVPAASALLAEWGADVIKIEHVERGDAMRGLMSSGLAMLNSTVHVLLEHSNRGKRSLGLDLTTEEGLAILHKLIATSDVFLTNKLPGVRSKLHIDVDDVLAHNPKIIYVAGTGQGERGPDADKGSYDHLAYWCRAGVAMGATRYEDAQPAFTPAPAFGDSIGAMTIAGGIMGALLHRERTGEATTVDVSLLATGLWSMGAAVALSLQLGMPWRPPPAGQTTGNPLVGNYETRDGRWVAFSCLQAAKYWPDMCRVLRRPELADDPRFADHESLNANAGAAADILRAEFAKSTLAEWRERLDDFIGQWAVVQDTLEAAADVQSVANGYVQEYTTSDGTPFKLVAPPVQYGGVPATPKRAPEFNEHGDAILADLGLDWDTVVDLKVRGVVA
jgi:crotonobetainyl-CoA:carnitine CoA-transferase CaiB-like acyl-CoA transferase